MIPLNKSVVFMIKQNLRILDLKIKIRWCKISIESFNVIHNVIDIINVLVFLMFWY